MAGSSIDRRSAVSNRCERDEAAAGRLIEDGLLGPFGLIVDGIAGVEFCHFAVPDVIDEFLHAAAAWAAAQSPAGGPGAAVGGDAAKVAEIGELRQSGSAAEVAGRLGPRESNSTLWLLMTYSQFVAST